MKKITLLFALMLLVAACGDSDDSSTPDTTQPAVSSTTIAAEEQHAEDAEHADDDPADNDHADDDHADEEDHADDAGHGDESEAATRTVEVAMSEFSFEPAEFEATAGETVEFVVTNLGVVEHEFRLSNAHRIEDHLASGHADHSESGGHHEDGDVILLVEPGGTGSVTVTFGEDTTLFTEVACLIPGHYEAGMKAPMKLST